jgi:hypothetical protein
MKLLTASVSPFLLLSPIYCLLARSPLAFVATRNAIDHAKFHASSNSMPEEESKHVKTILFVECGSFHACNVVVCCDQTIVVVDRPTHSLPVFGSLHQCATSRLWLRRARPKLHESCRCEELTCTELGADSTFLNSCCFFCRSQCYLDVEYRSFFIHLLKSPCLQKCH